MSRDPQDGQLIDPASLHKYLYAGGDPLNLIDPTGRAELFETSLIEGGSLRAGIVPALTELAGGAVSEAASYAVNQYLMAEALASTIQDALLDYFEAANWTELSKGIIKLYLCSSLVEGLEDLVTKYTGPIPPNIDLIESAEDKLREACLGLVGKIPIPF